MKKEGIVKQNKINHVPFWVHGHVIPFPNLVIYVVALVWLSAYEPFARRISIYIFWYSEDIRAVLEESKKWQTFCKALEAESFSLVPCKFETQNCSRTLSSVSSLVDYPRCWILLTWRCLENLTEHVPTEIIRGGQICSRHGKVS